MPNPNRRIREAVVLAGGFGTRLASEVPDYPKPMAPVAGRPFLRFVLDQLAAAGVLRVVVADGYKREVIEEHFGSSYRGMRIAYSSEDEPLGTGGAAKKAFSLCSDDWVYLLNGDSYCDTNFDAMEREAFSASNAEIVMSCVEVSDVSRYGKVAYDDLTGKVNGFEEKGAGGSGAINAGVYAVSKSAIAKMPRCFSFERDLLEPRAADGVVSCVSNHGLFIDIGIPDDYRVAQGLLASLAQKNKIAFFDRDGTINVDTGHLFEPDKLVLIDDTVEIMRQYSDDSEWKVVVVTNQAGIAKGLYSEDDMHALHRELDRRLADKGVVVDAYYFCPHHPDFTGECECRKPKPGMLLQAIREFDADPQECAMWGNKGSDEDAARKAGICSVVLVQETE